MTRILTIAALVLLISTVGFAQNTANTTANVTVTVLKALTITSTQNLAFGSVAQNTAKTVAVTDAAAAKWLVNGSAGTNVTVTFSAPSFAAAGLVISGYTVNGLASDNQAGSSGLTSGSAYALDGTTGNFYIWAGATLTVGTTAPGSYTTTATMTVAY